MSLKDYLLGQENQLENMEKTLHFKKGYGFLTAAVAPFDRHMLEKRFTQQLLLDWYVKSRTP